MRWWRWVKYDYERYIYSKIARRPNLKRCFKVTAAQQRLRSLWENICMKGVGRTIGGCERIEARFSFWFPLKHSILLCNVRSTDDCHKKKTFSLQYPTQPIYQNVNKEFSSNCGLYCTRILFLDQAKIVLTYSRIGPTHRNSKYILSQLKFSASCGPWEKLINNPVAVDSLFQPTQIRWYFWRYVSLGRIRIYVRTSHKFKKLQFLIRSLIVRNEKVTVLGYSKLVL